MKRWPLYGRLKQRRRPYESVPLKLKLTEDEIARISVDRHRFPGVEVEADLIRHYPYSDLLAHVVGYVGRISEKELQQVNEANYSGARSITENWGWSVITNLLHGTTGFKPLRWTREGGAQSAGSTSAIPGKILPSRWMSICRQSLQRPWGQFRGAVVVIEVETGGILALVSTPDLIQICLLTGIDSASYAAYHNSPDIPLFNRAYAWTIPAGFNN